MSVIIKTDEINAFIFDLDGVITDTASIHAKAWKRMFDEFLKERSKKGERGERFRAFRRSDYLRYVDGKPRYDGVKDFLASRKISIPHGRKNDTPDKNTVCGLGNRKNNYYLELLGKTKPRVYESSVNLVHAIRSMGLKTAIISSSKNCVQILRMTGTRSLFDAKVDGKDLERLGIPGKPDSAMFLEAAKRIGAKPKEAAVVEDASAGVEAGKRGGFGLVIGVARSKNGRELKEHGADVAVTDLKAVRLEAKDRERQKRRLKEEGGRGVRAIPSALNNHRVRSLLESNSDRLAIYLDYDGTLTKIVRDPSNAFMQKKTREVLHTLSTLCTVAILSGRDVEVVRRFVNLKRLVYVGSHGFDTITSDGKRHDYARWMRFLPYIDRAEKELRAKIEGVSGALVERKRFGVAVHYRNVERKRVAEVKREFKAVASTFSSKLRVSEGKKVFELLPNVDWNKGKALLHLMKTLEQNRGMGRKGAFPIFIGDDLTDEDAFEAIHDKGLGIRVVGGKKIARETHALYTLRNPSEVTRFLGKVVVGALLKNQQAAKEARSTR